MMADKLIDFFEEEESFNPEGEGYDYATAKKHGIKPDETGHWPSRVPQTGQILKGQKHPTYDKTIKGEEESGYSISRGEDGKYYSRKKDDKLIDFDLSEENKNKDGLINFGVNEKSSDKQEGLIDFGVEEKSEEYGYIENIPSISKRILTQFQRKGALAYKNTLDDIPFVRHLIPENEKWKTLKPESISETAISGLTPLARDIGLWSIGSGAVTALSKIPTAMKISQALNKIPKVGGLIAKSIPEFAKGSVLGGLTAGSEDIGEVSKKSAEFGAFASTIPWVVKGVSKTTPFLYEKLPQPLKNVFNRVGKAIGTVIERNKAANLVRQRYADITGGQLESELFIQDLQKILTPEERKLIPYILEGAYTDEAKILLDTAKKTGRYREVIDPWVKDISSYLDDAHKFLMENYGDDIGFVENFVPHIWDIPKNKSKEVINWFMTKNPHLKQRRITSLKEGIEDLGLKPKYDDIADILRVYDQHKIKAAANMKFAKGVSNLKDTAGIPLVKRIDKAPDDWVEIDHPALRRAMGRMVGPEDEKLLLLEKVPVKVHPEIADTVKSVLDEPIAKGAMNKILSVNSMAKFMNLSFSLFHHTALTETAVAAGIGKKAMSLWNPKKIIRAFKKGNYKKIFEDVPLAKDASQHGLELGHVMDVEGGNVLMKGLMDAEKNLRTRSLAKNLGSKALKLIRKPIEYNNKFLWEYLHSAFKLSAYEKLTADMLKKHSNKPAKLVKQEVAQFVNDTFGGQVWEILGKSNQWKKVMNGVLLSTDWTLSTVRQALSAFGVGATNASTKAIRQELGQDFWRRAILYYGGGVNLLNYAITAAYDKDGKGRFMWENTPSHKTHLFFGHNPDGTERYLRWGKQFRELPEFLLNPTEVIARKTSPIVRQTITQLWPDEYWQEDIAKNPFWSKKGLLGRTKELSKFALPYSVPQMSRQGFDPGASVIGLAMPMSKGMTNYKARKMFADILHQSFDQDELTDSQYNKIIEIRDSALRNNLDAESLFKQAKNQVAQDLNNPNKKQAKEFWIKYKQAKTKKDRMSVLNDVGKNPLIKKAFIKYARNQSFVDKQKKELNI